MIHSGTMTVHTGRLDVGSIQLAGNLNTAQFFYKCQLQLKLHIVILRNRYFLLLLSWVWYFSKIWCEKKRKGEENSADEHTSVKRTSETFICNVKQSLYIQLHELVIWGHLGLVVIFISFLFTRQLSCKVSARQPSNTNEFEFLPGLRWVRWNKRPVMCNLKDLALAEEPVATGFNH